MWPQLPITVNSSQQEGGAVEHMAGIHAFLRNVGGAKGRLCGPLISILGAGRSQVDAARNPGCRRSALAEFSDSPVGSRSFRWQKWQQLAVALGGDRFSSLAARVFSQDRCSDLTGPGVRRLSSGRRRIARGKYEVMKELGEGAFGIVYLGKNVQTGELVAIKCFDRGDMEDPDDRSKLTHREELVAREIVAMMSVRHPYITRLYDVTATMKYIYLVMEFVPGGDILNRLERGRFPEGEARKHFQHLIDAVHFCHSRGVYHRDLKPENLLMDASNNLKVSDFGLAGLKELNDTTPKGPYLQRQAGSRPYMAPEVLFKRSGLGFLGPPNDIWACGVILYVFLAGYHPFWDTNQPTKVIYKNIQIANYVCPPFMSEGARALIGRILDVNSRTRITTQEIYHDPWFKIDYVPPNFRQIGEVHAELQGIEEIFKQPEVEPSPVRPPIVSAFDLLSQENPLDDALAPYFHRLGRDTTIKQETRFTSQLPPKEILHLIGRTAKIAGFQVQKRGFSIKMDNEETAGNKEPLCVTAEVFDLGSPPKSWWVAHQGDFMVVLRKISGNPSDYREFIRRLSEQIGDKIVEVGNHGR